MQRKIDGLRKNVSRDAMEGAAAAAHAKVKARGAGSEADEAAERVLTGRGASDATESIRGMVGRTEAIILDELRPPWLIVNDTIIADRAYDHLASFEANREQLTNAAKLVGMVDLLNHSRRDYVGSGWMVDTDICVTNRHVAKFFAQETLSGAYQFRPGLFGDPLETRLDFIRQHNTDGLRRRVDILEVLYIAPDNGPDIALLRVENADGHLELFTDKITQQRPVAAIGYPAEDSRASAALMADVFDSIYDVKRFCPGLLTDLMPAFGALMADYSTLGGSSGSAVVDLQTAKVIGLHFAGIEEETNYAVSADVIEAVLKDVRTTSVGFVEVPTLESTPDQFAGDQGFDPAFLGSGALEVPLPNLGARAADVAPVSDDEGNVLKYTHFSVIQSQSRRLPMLTAVNIDGAKAFRLKRKGSWRTDGRIEKRFQADNTLYKSNPIDRGHLVRRMDPGWGDDEATAQRAERETFHYTNCAPQHKGLNQRDWVRLEDYILEASHTRGFKASVFTGPVFQARDRRLKRQPGAEDIQIPESYWKIAVMVSDTTGALHASGYILDQGTLIRDLTEAQFVFGEFKTYQVKIATIEQATGFDFGALRTHDPLRASTESVFGDGVREISGPDDLSF